MKSRILFLVCAMCTLTAVFAAPALADWDPPEPVTLSVSKSGGGTVTGGVEGSGIDCGATCSLVDQPGTHQEFVGIGNGNCGQGDRFECTAEYHDATLTAAPQAGWAFTGWGGDCSGAGTCSLTLSGDRSVSATFADVAPPTVAVTGPAGNAGGTFTVTADASDNNAINRVAFFVRGVKVAEDATAPYSAAVDSSALAEGTAELKAVAFDAVGQSATATRTITIDNLKPTLSFGDGPDGDTFGLGTTHTWTFTAADAGAGVQTVQCKLDGAGYAPCTGGNASHTVANLPDGLHTLSVKVTDKATRSDVFTRTVVIDGVAPQTTITGGTADGASSTATSASFDFAADQAGSTFKCRVYPAALTPGAFGPCSGASSHSAAGFSPGTYAFEVVSTDPYGNVDASPAKRTFTVKAPATSGGGQTPAGGGGGAATGGGGSTGGGSGPATGGGGAPARPAAASTPRSTPSGSSTASAPACRRSRSATRRSAPRSRSAARARAARSARSPRR